MKLKKSGQAVVEWAVLLPLFTLIMVLTFMYGQRFIVRHRLILAAREGALLYSSGRILPLHARHLVRQSLKRGFPSIDIPLENIYMGRLKGTQAWLFQFDEIRIRYKKMEEICVIKHAPPYWATGVAKVNVGPPYAW